ncbi:unnamed protein product, partial [Mesorhabditis spiculigera]
MSLSATATRPTVVRLPSNDHDDVQGCCLAKIVLSNLLTFARNDHLNDHYKFQKMIQKAKQPQKSAESFAN